MGLKGGTSEMALCAHCGGEIQGQGVKRRTKTGESRSWKYGKRKFYSDQWLHAECASQPDRRQLKGLLFVVLAIVASILFVHFSRA
jgi:hypothetical protein